MGPPARLTRTVLDTFDGRLHAADLRLEVNEDGAGAVELVLTGPGTPPARLAVAEPPVWPGDLPPGPFRSRLAEVTRERALVPLLAFTATVRIARRFDRRDRTTAAVAVYEDAKVASDSLAGESVVAEAPSRWFAELQPVVGQPGAADDLAGILRAAGVRALDGDVTAVVAAAVGISLAGHTSSPSVPLDPAEPALDAFRRVLANLSDTIAANLPGTVADTDSEFLHDLRVAVRRTRSVLAQGKAVLPDPVRDRYRDEFAWLGSVTTEPRDLDVQLLEWDGHTAALAPAERRHLEPVRAELETRRQDAHRRLEDALASSRARSALDSWTGWLRDPSVTGGDGPSAGTFVAGRVKRLHRRLLRDGRAISPDSPAERLHELRKDAKKLRYLLECFGPLFDAKPQRAFVRRLKALQDNLGAHQDAEVHLVELADLAQDLHERGGVDAAVLLAMGRLSDHLDRRRQQERDAFAERFTAFDAKDAHRDMRRLLRSARRR